jgi:hypothetical protein
MTTSSAADWSFEEIKNADPRRAKLLESAGAPEALIEDLGRALESAIKGKRIWIGIDSLRNGVAGKISDRASQGAS